MPAGGIAARISSAEGRRGGAGLAEREAGTEWVGDPGGLPCGRIFLGLPRSVPDASVSLPEPAPRMGLRTAEAAVRDVSAYLCIRGRVVDLRESDRAPSGTDGDIARDPVPLSSLCFLSLFLFDSLPLASERLGEPGRLSDAPAS